MENNKRISLYCTKYPQPVSCSCAARAPPGGWKYPVRFRKLYSGGVSEEVLKVHKLSASLYKLLWSKQGGGVAARTFGRLIVRDLCFCAHCKFQCIVFSYLFQLFGVWNMGKKIRYPYEATSNMWRLVRTARVKWVGWIQTEECSFAGLGTVATFSDCAFFSVGSAHLILI